MAIGDVVSGIVSLTQYQYATIQPPSGEEWIIHNIYFNNTVRMYFCDNTNILLFNWIKVLGHKPWTVFHLTNAKYLKIQAIKPGTTTLIGYDGIRTK